MAKDVFLVLGLTRLDIELLGHPTSKVSDEDMEHTARELGKYITTDIDFAEVLSWYLEDQVEFSNSCLWGKEGVN